MLVLIFILPMHCRNIRQHYYLCDVFKVLNRFKINIASVIYMLEGTWATFLNYVDDLGISHTINTENFFLPLVTVHFTKFYDRRVPGLLQTSTTMALYHLCRQFS